ncbi:hypothetical protein MSAN_00496200 [Mycena sanguinolenta]|uniref:Uncharacterized protein n=1 Tax=Mycena sanguinolenta TaxID=230812 RepID=A0A8H6Z5E4_9AGAR|nr:hypothetical protein MSAN_00496200 [Mycena sanguinolenta]
MLAWLKKIPSASPDLIKLWEDYECMVLFERSPSHRSRKRTSSCSPEFLQILVSVVMVESSPRSGLSKLRGRLDLTWTEMRASICSPSSNIGSDSHGLTELAVRLACRDVALQWIRKMVKNQLDLGGKAYSWESRDEVLASRRKLPIDNDAPLEHKKQWVSHSRAQRELADGISYLVRLSPPCPILYRQLWCIPIGPTMGASRSSETSLVYHVSKWLESFPNPTTELVAFWKQVGGLESNLLDTERFNDAEKRLREEIIKWEKGVSTARRRACRGVEANNESKESASSSNSGFEYVVHMSSSSAIVIVTDIDQAVVRFGFGQRGTKSGNRSTRTFVSRLGILKTLRKALPTAATAMRGTPSTGNEETQATWLNSSAWAQAVADGERDIGAGDDAAADHPHRRQTYEAEGIAGA